MSLPIKITTMPSENSFKKQADAASDALKTFVSVQNSKSTAVIKAAMAELIDATVDFNNFVPFFVSHSLFQEIPPAVHIVLEKFSKKNPSFEMPSSVAKVAGLDARVRDSMAATKRGSSLCSFSFILFRSLPMSDAATVHADKGNSRKPKNSSVNF